jgi:hypothetical protein
LKRPRPDENETPEAAPDQHSELPEVKGTVH